MVCSPALPSLLISSILTSVGMTVFSFCRPSRAPTSTILTISLGACDAYFLRDVDIAGRQNLLVVFNIVVEDSRELASVRAPSPNP